MVFINSPIHITTVDENLMRKEQKLNQYTQIGTTLLGNHKKQKIIGQTEDTCVSANFNHWATHVICERLERIFTNYVADKPFHIINE